MNKPVFALTLSLLLAVTACGGVTPPQAAAPASSGPPSASPATSTGAAPSTAAAASKPTAAVSAASKLPAGLVPEGKLQQVIQRGSVNIFLNSGFLPYEFTDEKGQLVGLDIDLLNKMWKDGLGVNVSITDGEFQGLVPAVVSGKADFVMSAIGATKARAEQVDFTIPYSPSMIIIVIRADDNTIKSEDDLNGKIVGAETGSTPATRGQNLDAQLKQQGKPGFKELRTYQSAPTVWEDLKAKRLDAAVEGFSNLLAISQKRPGEFKMMSRLGPLSYFAMLVPKGQPSLLEFANSQIKQWKGDGSLATVHKKWFGDSFSDLEPLLKELPDQVTFGS
jgi:polar amino acid transport system substrate-binding protein